MYQINEDITLVPYYPDEKVALEWYQDLELCKQVDNIDFVYDLPRLKRMYQYLSTHGDCYYIQYEEQLVGDCTLLSDGEIAIVIAKPFQNRHIGQNCVKALIQMAIAKKLPNVKAQIYSFNHQSQRMFTKLGFVQVAEEWFELNLENDTYLPVFESKIITE